MVLGSQYDIDVFVDEATSIIKDDHEPDEDEHCNDDLNLAPTKLWMYDTTPGGSGAIEQVFQDFEAFVAGAATFAEACDCDHGCPNCLSIGRCGQRNIGLNKQMGLSLADLVLIPF
jgi:ATP-dependent helicase YprA (DUF1998 family)